LCTLFRLIFIDLQNVGVISAAPCILPSMKQMTAEGKVQHGLHNVTFFHIIQCFQEEKLEETRMQITKHNSPRYSRCWTLAHDLLQLLSTLHKLLKTLRSSCLKIAYTAHLMMSFKFAHCVCLRIYVTKK